MKKSISVIVMCLCLLLIGCSKEPKAVINIATKPMTEQLIIGEMLGLFIEENTDLSVDITQGVGGGTGNIQPALLKGDFDLYPEYTGTAWNYVLKKTEFPSDENLMKQLKQEYADKYDLSWVGMYGFNNTYGLIIRKEIADKYGIKTYSDLTKIAPELAFGAEYDFFEREDGYNALCKEYGYNFKKEVDLDIGLKYQALEKKEIDVMVMFTTDGQLSKADAVVLEDNKSFYQTYYCGTVIRNDVLKKYPELEQVLLKMENILTDEEIANLNYQVEKEGKDEKTVAKEFLISKGLLKK